MMMMMLPPLIFLGSMLPQYIALSVSFVKKNLCVRSLGYIVGASPPRVCPFIGRQSLLDPCMLPTPLCGIFPLILHI